MIDWEEILRAEDEDELKKAKLWLFKENMRLENERNEFEQYRDKFLSERNRLREEIAALNKRTVMERKRLKDESLFFEKKMDILKDGFRQLDEDRKKLEQEKKRFYAERAADVEERSVKFVGGNVAEVLFRNANNPLALKKRYRDLVKIFHPDNLFGDEELAQQINKEFMRRRREDI